MSDVVFNREVLRESYGFVYPKEGDENYETYQWWKVNTPLMISRQGPLFLKLFDEGKINTVSSKSKKMIRGGIPPEFRGVVWFTISGGKKRLRKNPGRFKELVSEALRFKEKGDDPKKLEHLEYIENDLKRSFPEHDFFRKKANIDRLRNILFAYSVFNPKVGYCQGLNFVGGIFLFFMNDEEKAFWTLVACLQKLPADMYDPSLNGVYCESYVLCKMIKERRRSVYEIFKRMEFSENEYAIFSTPWFMCLFLNIFPIETSLRVMDSFLLEGNKVLFRIAITVLSMCEKELKVKAHKGEVINFLKSYCLGLYDCETLMKKSFKIRNFSKSKLMKLRREFRQRQKEEGAIID